MKLFKLTTLALITLSSFAVSAAPNYTIRYAQKIITPPDPFEGCSITSTQNDTGWLPAFEGQTADFVQQQSYESVYTCPDGEKTELVEQERGITVTSMPLNETGDGTWTPTLDEIVAADQKVNTSQSKIDGTITGSTLAYLDESGVVIHTIDTIDEDSEGEKITREVDYFTLPLLIFSDIILDSELSPSNLAMTFPAQDVIASRYHPYYIADLQGGEFSNIETFSSEGDLVPLNNGAITYTYSEQPASKECADWVTLDNKSMITYSYPDSVAGFEVGDPVDLKVDCTTYTKPFGKYSVDSAELDLTSIIGSNFPLSASTFPSSTTKKIIADPSDAATTETIVHTIEPELTISISYGTEIDIDMSSLTTLDTLYNSVAATAPESEFILTQEFKFDGPVTYSTSYKSPSIEGINAENSNRNFFLDRLVKNKDHTAKLNLEFNYTTQALSAKFLNIVTINDLYSTDDAIETFSNTKIQIEKEISKGHIARLRNSRNTSLGNINTVELNDFFPSADREGGTSKLVINPHFGTFDHVRSEITENITITPTGAPDSLGESINVCTEAVSDGVTGRFCKDVSERQKYVVTGTAKKINSNYDVDLTDTIGYAYIYVGNANEQFIPD